MRVIGDVAWDEGLESFKGRETADYVRVAAATAKVCASCELTLEPGSPLSLVVDIIDGTDPDGQAYLIFYPFVCHRRCCQPAVTVSRSSEAVALQSLGAQFTLGDQAGAEEREVAVLAYTVDPVVVFRQPGGESVSAHVASLLSLGFRLSAIADLHAIRQRARSVRGAECLVTQRGFMSLELQGDSFYSRQLDPNDPGHTAWLEAARNGDVLVISGDHLSISPSGLDLTAAARLGTLVTGWVPFRTLPRDPVRQPGSAGSSQTT